MSDATIQKWLMYDGNKSVENTTGVMTKNYVSLAFHEMLSIMVVFFLYHAYYS